MCLISNLLLRGYCAVMLRCYKNPVGSADLLSKRREVTCTMLITSLGPCVWGSDSARELGTEGKKVNAVEGMNSSGKCGHTEGRAALLARVRL